MDDLNPFLPIRAVRRVNVGFAIIRYIIVAVAFDTERAIPLIDCDADSEFTRFTLPFSRTKAITLHV